MCAHGVEGKWEMIAMKGSGLGGGGGVVLFSISRHFERWVVVANRGILIGMVAS